MQKENPVIKNYILLPQKRILKEKQKFNNIKHGQEYLAYNIINEIRISFSKY